MKEVIQNHVAGYQQIGFVSQVQNHPIGFRVQAESKTLPRTIAEYLYFQAAAPLAKDAVAPVRGIPGKAVSAMAKDDWGWSKAD